LIARLGPAAPGLVAAPDALGAGGQDAP
jgi:hypothetical protein